MINCISRGLSWSLLLLFFFSSQISYAGTVSGELRKWHKVTISFDGPNTSETATPNPFTNYKLQVTFTNGNTTYNVPGYYAADGNTANSSATSGNKWLVHFAPDQTGTWTYTASFRQGTDVALNTSPTAGSSAGFMDGETGTFNIAATNKTGRDHRGKGRLKYVGQHYLQHQETGDYFVKMGADAPENTFAYNDFDAVPNRGNRRKTWSPHAGDYNAGDAAAYTWQNGKGTELLGVIKYLSDKGMNVFSFLTFSLHGDDENVFPHLLKVGEGTYNTYNDAQQWNNGVHHDRFDVSRLAQWEKIMEYGDKKGMYMHFKTLEQENDNIMDGNGFGRERRIYYRELIARFGHHLALNWNLSEECSLTTGVIEATASYIKAVDPYDHIIVFHTFPGNTALGWPKYNAHLGPSSGVDGASIQGGDDSFNDIRPALTEWIDKSRNANKKWVVAIDEQGTGQVGIKTDPTDRFKVRQKVIWNSLMAGAAGAEFYYGSQTGCTDMNCQNHRTRDQKYSDANFALKFFQDYLPFHQMLENDGRTSDGADYVFEKNNEIYAVYRPNGGSTGINLPAGDWAVQWYNPRNGVMQTTTTTITNTLTAPDNNDWVALITNCTGFEETNGLIVIEMENLDISGTDWSVETATPGYTGTGYLEWKGTNYFGTPGNGLIEVPLTINTPGTYRFQWRNRVGFGTVSSEHNDSWLKFPDADDFFGEKPGSIVYPKGSGKFPVPLGAGALGWFKTWAAGALNWSWSTITSDGDGHNIFVTFNSPGVYTMQISGRSQYHQIDRLVMYLPGVANPTNLSNAQTDCTPGGGGGCTVGAVCDDNDPDTYFDKFDGNCTCAGMPAQPIPGRIEAESYFEAGGGIQDYPTTDGSGSKIGLIDNGDSTRYLVDVLQPGDYTIRLRGASNTGIGDVDVLLNGFPIANFQVPITGGWDVFQTFVLDTTLVTPGVQVMSLRFNSATAGAIMDVNWIEFERICLQAGTACDDADACTINDVFDANCNCSGTFEDVDNDTVCDEEDVCPNFDDRLIGTPCDDNNPATTVDVYTSNCTCEGTVGPTTICLEPIHDAYLQGATRFNTTELRVEAGNRVAYLMYDLSNITGTVVSAEFEMTVGTDAGTGRVTIQKGATNNWTETNLSTANSPAPAGALGELTQANFQVNTTYTWPLNGVTLGDNFSIILTQTTGNDISFRSQEHGIVTTRPTLCLTFQPPQPVDQTVECDVQFLLEGAFDGQDGMRTTLQSLNLLPMGQPYNVAPWSYNGTEGAGWMPADYPVGTVDWALVSLRTSPLASDEVGKGAVLLLDDGTTYENLSVDLEASIDELYIMVEHRNHLPVMTPMPISIVNGMVSYDFTQADSYSSGVGQGQKSMGSNWVLFAANADQSLATGYEITGADNILWLAGNGLPGVYASEDFNMDGDVTGADKVMWSYNNGIFSSIPK